MKASDVRGMVGTICLTLFGITMVSWMMGLLLVDMRMKERQYNHCIEQTKDAKGCQR